MTIRIEKSRTGVQTKIFGLDEEQAKEAVERFNSWLIARNDGKPQGGVFKAQGARICRDGSVRVSIVLGKGTTRKIKKIMGIA